MIAPTTICDHVGDDMAIFQPVLASIHLERLPDFATSIRRRQQNIKIGEAPDAEDRSIRCSILSPPLSGSFNILFPIQFEDGLRWLLKVPAIAHPGRWDEMAARALKAEALTMQLLKRDTSIPLPEVYSFDATLENELNCAYILMEYVCGVPLHDVWFNQHSSEEEAENLKVRSLRDVAKAMVQLNKFDFTQGGAPIFDDEGCTVNGVGPAIKLDNSAMLDRLEKEDDDETAIFCELGPFDDVKSYFLAMLDRREPPPYNHDQGVYKLLRLFIDWLVPFFAPKISGSPRFVLSHPDLNFQNVLVSDEDGRLCGLIDWDGIAAVPRCIGNERYPSWLTRDWEPDTYGYKEGEAEEGAIINENSPDELTKYREMYVQFMKDSSDTEHPEEVEVLTRHALLLENVLIAAEDPISTPGIVEKIFDEIKSRVAANKNIDEKEEEEIHLWEVTFALADGDLDDQRLRWIKEGFEALLISLGSETL